MIVDTHVHLDHKQLLGDIERVIARANAAGVNAFIIAGADPKDLITAQKLSHKYESVYFAAGVHPNDIDLFDENYIKQFIDDPKCVAIGECGLDYFRLPKNSVEAEPIIAKQKQIFARQIELAINAHLPLIVHIRDAANDSLELLMQYDTQKVGGVLHCFSGECTLLSLADRGFYFGIGGVLTFKNAQLLQQTVRSIPLDRLLIETDAPYLAPMPHRGERNEPAFAAFTVQKLSELLAVPSDQLCATTTQNAQKCFPKLAI